MVALTSCVGSPAAGCPPQDARSIPRSSHAINGRRTEYIIHLMCEFWYGDRLLSLIRQDYCAARRREGYCSINIPYFNRLEPRFRDGQATNSLQLYLNISFLAGGSPSRLRAQPSRARTREKSLICRQLARSPSHQSGSLPRTGSPLSRIRSHTCQLGSTVQM
jgi:hypothetical protein